MNNPVAWQLWDSEAIDLAKKFNRLIFLSIGYSACHCPPLSLASSHTIHRFIIILTQICWFIFMKNWS